MRKPAIVISAYNRPEALNRLLRSISKAKYDCSDISLVISIDGGGDYAVKELATSYEWRYGEKRVIKHDKNLGLKEHVLSCGDLTQEYGSIIMLEDDLIVSPGFYNYALQAVNEYVADERIAGVSLYLCRGNENSFFFPFCPLDNGYDAFFMQVPSSCGQVWTNEQWQRFRDYYSRRPFIPDNSLLPSNVLGWNESSSWKKHFYNYMVERDLYFVYPFMSLSSNWGDIGEHFDCIESGFRVQLSMVNNKEYRFPHFTKKSVVYDGYLEIIPDYLKEQGFYPDCDFGVDLYGTKDLEKHSNNYFLSTKRCVNPIAQYGGEMIPLEQNVMFNIPGKVISFAKRSDFSNEIDDLVLEKIVSQYHRPAYNSGYFAGKLDGEINVRKTSSYKIGRVITTPCRILRDFL